MINFYVGKPKHLNSILDEMSRWTREWELRAARGECGWICADCCSSFPKGMPDECDHGIEYCTKLIERDKKQALEALQT